jgi:hypothetical protein
LLRFWWGPYIDGNLTYRPLSAWLFTAQYHLFGRQDRLWCAVDIGLHLVIELLLVWVVALWIRGPLAARLAGGAGAALALGAPGLADDRVQAWIIGWWPSQPDEYSLICTLLLFGFTTLYLRRRGAVWAVWAALAFLFGISFKEMAYVGGLGACLLLLRHPKARPLLLALAIIGIAAFLFRTAIYHGFPRAAAQDYSRVPRFLSWALRGEMDRFGSVAPHLGCLALAGIAFLVARKMLSEGASGALAALTYLASAVGALGLPTERPFAEGFGALVEWSGAVILLAGLWRWRGRWPVAEVTAIALLSVVMGQSFPEVYAWHRYWGNALTSVVLVFGAAGALGWLKDRTRGKGLNLSRRTPVVQAGFSQELST